MTHNFFERMYRQRRRHLLSLWVTSVGSVCASALRIRCHILNLWCHCNNTRVPVQQEAAERISPERMQTWLTTNISNRSSPLPPPSHLLPNVLQLTFISLLFFLLPLSLLFSTGPPAINSFNIFSPFLPHSLWIYKSCLTYNFKLIT